MNNSTDAVDVAAFFIAAEIDTIHKYFTFFVVTNFTQLILATFGMVFNMALVYTVLNNRSAHTSTGLFLAVGSFGDFLSHTTLILPTFTVLFEWHFLMPFCYFLQIHGLLGIILGAWNILFISMDRLFAVCLPLGYDSLIRGIKKYVALLNCLPIGVFSYLAYLLYDFALQHPKLQVFCLQGDISGDERTNFVLSLFSGIQVAPIVIYLVILAILKGTKRDTGNAKSQRETTRRITKSIMAIISIVFSCFAISFLGGQLVPILVQDFGVQMIIFRSLGQLFTFSTSINAPVLFFFSTEYRELMKKEFRVARWLSNKISPPNSSSIAVPMAQMVSTQIGTSSAAAP